VANIIMMTTTSIGALYAGRLLIGLANGYFMTFSQLYIQESSTAKYRGLFLTLFQFFTSFVSIFFQLEAPVADTSAGNSDWNYRRLGHREAPG
jgi:MFS family permease